MLQMSYENQDLTADLMFIKNVNGYPIHIKVKWGQYRNSPDIFGFLDWNSTVNQ